jgi:hypothetical protein
MSKNINNPKNTKAENSVSTGVNRNKGGNLAKKDKKLEKHIDELRESYKKIGVLHPVIETKFGVAAGASRIRVVNCPICPVV